MKADNDILAAALGYAAKGWSVFPVPPDTRKSYLAEEHCGSKWGMTNDPDLVRQYWQRFPLAGIGLPTGVSGFWVLDIDTKEGHDVDGVATLQGWKAEHGALPQTLMVQTPSGG